METVTDFVFLGSKITVDGDYSHEIKRRLLLGRTAFDLWCWTRLLRVSWITRKSNQSIPKQINPEYSLGRLILKSQYFGHLMRRAGLLEKTLILEKIEGRRRRGCQRLDGTTDSMNMSSSMLQEIVSNRGAWCAAVHGVAKSWTRLGDRTTATTVLPCPVLTVAS